MGGHARYLAREEVVVLKVRHHLVVLVGPLAAAVAGILVAAAGGTWVSPQESGDLVDVVLGLIAVVLVGRFAFKLWEWLVDHIVVTDERIVEVSGIFTRRIASMPISKVIDMIYVRTLPGRILGYGDMIVESAAQEQGLTRISHLPHPDDFYRTITTLVTQGLQSLLPEDEELIPTDRDEEDTGPLPRIIV